MSTDTKLGRELAERVLENYDRMTTQRILKAGANESLRASGFDMVRQHPAADGLGVGEYAAAELAIVFVDLSGFTGRTFWDDLDDVTNLANAVLSAFSDAIHKLGGHVLGLRGDGVFASFGPTQDPRVAVGMAAAAAAACLDAVEKTLNPLLRNRGMEPVQVRAGADFGIVNFVRTGTMATSEINVVGFAANFAAKCEKYANSWEVVVGETFANHIAAPALLRKHVEAPKRYTRDYETKSYSFYAYSWRPMVGEVDDTVHQLGGRRLEELGI